VTVIHGTALAAVHAQPGAAVTVIDAFPPVALTGTVVGDTWYVQPGVCSTVNGLPATVIVPARAGPDVASTANRMTAGPAPVAPSVMRTHGTFTPVTHGQPPSVARLIEPLPPDAPKIWDTGLMTYEQPWPCVTLCCCPATVTDPARGGPVVAATENDTAAEPFPGADVIVIHGAFDVAVQVQSGLDATTLIVPVPPACENVEPDSESVIAQSDPSCATSAR
jgi:hypothetical protein